MRLLAASARHAARRVASFVSNINAATSRRGSASRINSAALRAAACGVVAWHRGARGGIAAAKYHAAHLCAIVNLARCVRRLAHLIIISAAARAWRALLRGCAASRAARASSRISRASIAASRAARCRTAVDLPLANALVALRASARIARAPLICACARALVSCALARHCAQRRGNMRFRRARAAIDFRAHTAARLYTTRCASF